MTAIIRYLAAALAASLCFVVSGSVSTLWSYLLGEASIRAVWSEAAFAPTLLAVTLIVVIPLGVPFACVAALLARALRANGYAYWIGAAGVSAMIAAALVIWCLHGNFPSIRDDGSGVTFAQSWWRLAQVAIPSGVAGGFAFKWLSVRFAKSARVQSIAPIA